MPISHVHTLRVRYSECDPQGNVFHANYFTYFDIAFRELWRAAFGSYEAMLDDGVHIVMAEANARYLAPGRFEDVLEIEATAALLDAAGVVTELTVARDEGLLVLGRMVHVFVDRGSMAETEIPTNIREALS